MSKQKLLQVPKKVVTLQRVFHGIRLLRLTKIGCRETINFFFVPILWHKKSFNDIRIEGFSFESM
jgi:hypothetical protein